MNQNDIKQVKTTQNEAKQPTQNKLKWAHRRITTSQKVTYNEWKQPKLAKKRPKTSQNKSKGDLNRDQNNPKQTKKRPKMSQKEA